MSRRRRRHAAGLAAILGVGAVALAAGAPAGATTPLGAQARLSVTGADGDPNFDALDAAVAHNPAADQHLVVWSGSDGAGSEIFARLLDGAGTPLGAQFRISGMGPPASRRVRGRRAGRGLQRAPQRVPRGLAGRRQRGPAR